MYSWWRKFTNTPRDNMTMKIEAFNRKRNDSHCGIVCWPHNWLRDWQPANRRGSVIALCVQPCRGTITISTAYPTLLRPAAHKLCYCFISFSPAFCCCRDTMVLVNSLQLISQRSFIRTPVHLCLCSSPAANIWTHSTIGFAVGQIAASLFTLLFYCLFPLFIFIYVPLL